MSWEDTLKIAGLVLSLVGGVYFTMRWALNRYDSIIENQNQQLKSQSQELTSAVSQQVESLSKSLDEIRSDQRDWKNSANERMNAIEKDHLKFREQVADKYVKKESWLEHTIILERKIDNFFRFINKEFLKTARELGQLKGETNEKHSSRKE